MKSIGIIDAFAQEIKRKTIWAKDNPLYWVVFIFVFVLIGTIGFWGEHVFINNKRSVDQFFNEFTAINLTKYVAPILTAIVSDWILKIFSQSNKQIAQGKKTFYFLTFVITIVSILLMAYGLSSEADKYSLISIFATAIVLLIYFFSYCENPLYEDKGDPKAASANNVEADLNRLQGGGLE